MPKYRVLTQPIGLINGYPWPAAGEVIELSAVVNMPELEAVEEIRPSIEAGVEKRPARKRVAKP